MKHLLSILPSRCVSSATGYEVKTKGPDCPLAAPTSTGKKAGKSTPNRRPNALQAKPVQRQTSQTGYDGVVCGTASSSICAAQHSRSPLATRRKVSLIASDRLKLT